MSDNYTFHLLDPDAVIEGIGLLFRKIGGTMWGINLEFDSEQEKSSLTTSYAPVLSRQRRLRSTGVLERRGWKDEFYIASTTSWDVCRIGDCPMKRTANDRDQFCFVFSVANGKTVYLPQFELARALFLRDGYLARSAMESDVLDLDFQVIRDWENGIAHINVMPTAGYPLRYFNELKSRNFLSWILLDAQARRSYRSISWWQKKTGYRSGGYEKWNFRFDPPELPNAYFKVRGLFDKSTRSLFVNEIVRIGRIQADIPEVIEMYHPKFTTPSSESVNGKVHVAPSGDIEGYHLHDAEPANADGSRRIIQGEKVESEFTKAFVTNRVTEKKRKISSSIPNGEEGEGHVIDASSEEPIAGNGRTGVDWDISEDLTKNEHLFKNKFKCFLDMVELMAANNDCTVVSDRIIKLPSVPRCSKHRLSDGNPRCLDVVELRVEDKHVVLLEVDTSDADKALSTRVLVPSKVESWDDDLKRIMHELVRGSLVWPLDVLDQVCGKNGHIWIRHPKCAGGHQGLLLPDTIEGWAGRFYWRIREMLRL